jgi:hypothetical protein
MPPHNVAALVHLVGFLTGAALYAMLFALVLRRRVGDDRLPLGTAILGLLWTVSGLAAFGIRDFAGADPPSFLIATAYSALGFLPAVVVHSVLRSQSEARYRRTAAIIIGASYVVSTVTETLMFWATFHGRPVPSPVALQMLTWFYLALTIPIFLLTRRRTGSARGWSIVALAVFAVSALHLSHREGTTESWFIELAGHHASIPLIFAIDIDVPHELRVRGLETLHVDMQLVRVVGNVVECERAVRRRRRVLLESGDVVAKLHHDSGQRLVVRPEDLAAHDSGARGEKSGWGNRGCNQQKGEGNSFHSRSPVGARGAQQQ